MNRMRRALLRRLIAPLMRGRHPPEYVARGTAVGLVVAFTPTVGVQMPAVFLLWLIARYLRPNGSDVGLRGSMLRQISRNHPTLFTKSPKQYAYSNAGWRLSYFAGLNISPKHTKAAEGTESKGLSGRILITAFV